MKFNKTHFYVFTVKDAVNNFLHENLCKICLCNEALCLLLPCMHLCLCTQCVCTVQTCIVCRKQHTSIVTVYKS